MAPGNHTGPLSVLGSPKPLLATLFPPDLDRAGSLELCLLRLPILLTLPLFCPLPVPELAPSRPPLPGPPGFSPTLTEDNQWKASIFALFPPMFPLDIVPLAAEIGIGTDVAVGVESGSDEDVARPLTCECGGACDVLCKRCDDAAVR